MSVLKEKGVHIIGIPTEAIKTCANRFRQNVADGSIKPKMLEDLEFVCLELLEKSTDPIQKTCNMGFMQAIRMARESITQ